MKITTLSPTSLELYDNCPFCFLCKIEKKPFKATPQMNFGSRLHKSIEKYHKEGLAFFDEDLQGFMEEYMMIYTREFAVCEEFWELQLLDTDITFKLKIDLIKNDLLIEHKTSASEYSCDFLDNHRQITAYSWAWQRLYTEREKGIRLNLFLTKEKKLVTMDTNRFDYQFIEWQEWVKEIISGIEENNFEPKDGKFHNYPECIYYKDRG